MKLLQVTLVAFITYSIQAAPYRPGNKCISTCKGLDNGDYQSCLGCHVYATCAYGILYDNRPCPKGTFWDDVTKRCEYSSSTCPGPVTSEPVTASEFEEKEVGECIASCKGRLDGDYQSCRGCHVYATCASGILYDNRPCPKGTFWDDVTKRCEYSSSTCPGPVTSEPVTASEFEVEEEVECISSCKGRPDGDYQSCQGCDVYASCVNERLIDNRPCPKGTFWDDVKKRCIYSSSTCFPTTVIVNVW